MNQRNNNLQYIAIGVALLTALFGIYWQGDDLFAQNYHLENLLTSEGESVLVSSERLAELEERAALTEQIREERDVLRAQLLGTSTPDVSDSGARHLASVIGRPPQSPYDTFVINIGDDAGISLGSAVWWPPGVYLGEVVSVNKRSSLVELVSSADVPHPAVVEGVPVVLRGTGGDGMYAEVPASLEIPLGAAVISEQYSLPIGLVVAKSDLTTTDQQRLHVVRHVSSSVIKDVYVE